MKMAVTVSLLSHPSFTLTNAEQKHKQGKPEAQGEIGIIGSMGAIV